MNATHREQYLDLSGELEAALIAGARDLAPVRGLTHDFYKYPARFSPAFARTLIEVFTEPGDVCLDPHVGGLAFNAVDVCKAAVRIEQCVARDFLAELRCACPIISSAAKQH